MSMSARRRLASVRASWTNVAMARAWWRALALCGLLSVGGLRCVREDQPAGAFIGRNLA